jgi:hypothetical protein
MDISACCSDFCVEWSGQARGANASALTRLFDSTLSRLTHTLALADHFTVRLWWRVERATYRSIHASRGFCGAVLIVFAFGSCAHEQQFGVA